jgi:L,D-transpeptidase ErfK/SrfK
MNMNKISKLVISGLFLTQTVGVEAITFKLPPPGVDIVGKVQTTRAYPGETLTDVGRRFGVGFSEMLDANPRVDPKYGVEKGQNLVVPSQFILPPGPRQGIVINLAELRMYYFPAHSNVVVTVPVGIGRIGFWQTPVGQTKIVEKVLNPTWHPTASVRADAVKYGLDLPSAVPPGPDNPLGKHMLRLGWRSYLIHGTNDPQGVGKRTSAGCLRLFPEDAESLYYSVPVGTPVRVINTPYKVGWSGKQLFLEYHEPLAEERHKYQGQSIPMVNAIHQEIGSHRMLIKWDRAQEEAKRASGIPIAIGTQVGGTASY